MSKKILGEFPVDIRMKDGVPVSAVIPCPRCAVLEKVVEAAEKMMDLLHKDDDEGRRKRCLHPVCIAIVAARRETR